LSNSKQFKLKLVEAYFNSNWIFKKYSKIVFNSKQTHNIPKIHDEYSTAHFFRRQNFHALQSNKWRMKKKIISPEQIFKQHTIPISRRKNVATHSKADELKPQNPIEKKEGERNGESLLT
jgi:hypothetical protein